MSDRGQVIFRAVCGSVVFKLFYSKRLQIQQQPLQWTGKWAGLRAQCKRHDYWHFLRKIKRKRSPDSGCVHSSHDTLSWHLILYKWSFSTRFEVGLTIHQSRLERKESPRNSILVSMRPWYCESSLTSSSQPGLGSRSLANFAPDGVGVRNIPLFWV